MRALKCLNLLLAAGAAMLIHPAQAITVLPEKSGFSGFVNLGMGGITVKSNTMAETGAGIIDLGSSTIDGLNNSPDRESSVIPVLNFEGSYTFADTRTQLYVGNLMEDFIRFEMNTSIGVRQQAGDAGLLGASFLASTVPTEVWKDPFLVGESRDATDRDSEGFRISWAQIFNTGLELRYTDRDVEVDDELSGQSLGLDEDELRSLVRDGDHDRFDLRYEYTSADKRHIVTPGVSYIDHDRRGDAVSMDGYALDLNYVFVYQPRLRFVVNAVYGKLDSDAVHPIYGRKDDSTRFGLTFTVFRAQPFGLENWVMNISAAALEDDHEIRFYDTSVRVLTFGMLRRF